MTRLTIGSKLLPLLFILLMFSCGEEEVLVQQDFSTSVEEFDITYGSDELQTYDLFLPADRSSETTDLVLLIHGGGWTSGDKSDINGIVDLLQSTMPSYAIANMNYRLDIDPNQLFVDHMDDVDAVINDLMGQNEDFGISNNIMLAGVSAGGHMTLLYAYSRNDNGYVKVAGNIIGPTNFLDPSYVDSDNPTFIATIAAIVAATGRPLTDLDFYNAVSPLHFVDGATIPTIQFLGDEDPLIPLTQGTSLQDELNSARVVNDLIIYEGEGHGWTDPDNWTDTAERFAAFVADNM
jgi:acetyl esterase/lipase